WHAALMQSAEILDVLHKLKGVWRELCVEWRLGWDGDAQRITIPIRDARNRYVNVKKYDLFKMHAGKEKYISLKGYGEARLFPEQALEAEEIDIVEGELKMIVHRARGFNATTETGGAHTWKNEWTSKFAGKRVRIWHDIDDAGRSSAVLRCAQLATVAAEVKNVLVPLDKSIYPKGGIEDWYLAGATPEDAQALVAATPVYVPQGDLEDPAFADPIEYEVLLGAASKAYLYHKKISTPVIVSAKD